MSFDSPANLHETFAGALAGKDVEAALNLYEDGAVSRAPDGTELRGHAALREMLTTLTDGENAMAGTQRRNTIVGDLALTSTSWSAQWPGADGTITTRHGTTAEVSRRQPDGRWKVVIDSPFFA